MSPRDEQRLAGCHPQLIAAVEAICEALPVFVVVGVRTTAQQQAEWAQGRTVPGPDATPMNPLGRIVTHCDGILHKGDHQVQADTFGHAADLAFLPTAQRPNPFDARWPWPDLGASAESKGLRWGGRFKGLADLDHVELP